jgi:hypothetical protein
MKQTMQSSNVFNIFLLRVAEGNSNRIFLKKTIKTVSFKFDSNFSFFTLDFRLFIKTETKIEQKARTISLIMVDFQRDLT